MTSSSLSSSPLPVTVTNEKWVLEEHPNGKFRADRDVRLVTEPLLLGTTEDPSNPAAGRRGGASSCTDQEVIVQVDTLSVDAFLRTMLDDSNNGDDTRKAAFHGNLGKGSTIPALGYGTIVAAGRYSGWKPGSVVMGMLGAQTYAKIQTSSSSSTTGATKRNQALSSQLSLPWMPPTSSLGLLGLTTGLTAYVGVFCVCRPPRKGETVVITASAGAVGSIAAQLAKTTGARVIGIAGNKNDYLINDLQLNGAVNYKQKSPSLEEQLDECCPDGVDFVFDNVGGPTLDALLDRISPGGRIVICGAVSQYENDNGVAKYGPTNYLKLAERGAEMKGFTVLQYTSQLPFAVFFLWFYYLRGKVKMTESINQGIQSFPTALQKLFSGGNIGKTLVHVKQP